MRVSKDYQNCRCILNGRAVPVVSGNSEFQGYTKAQRRAAVDLAAKVVTEKTKSVTVMGVPPIVAFSNE